MPSTGRRCGCYVDFVTRSEAQRRIYGDNRSALSLCMGDVGAWRTRHLRLRTAGLRSAAACPASGWTVHHVKGTELPADGLTKVLQGAAFATSCTQVA